MKERDKSGNVVSHKAGEPRDSDVPTNLQLGPDGVEGDHRDDLEPNESPNTVLTINLDDPDHLADGAVPCVGWLMVWDGPGKGISHTLKPGNNSLGRSAACDVALEHGDGKISKDGVLGLVYNADDQEFVFVNRGSTNTPRVDGQAVYTQQRLTAGSIIQIGDTSLCFVPFCTPDRNWG